MYAKRTEVSVSKSKEEIERVLARYGADAFSYSYDQMKAVVQFRMEGRILKYLLEMPPKNEFEFTPSKKWLRDEETASKEWEKACRQRWRALKLVIQAKLEAVACGISTFDEEFLSFIVLPSGDTVGGWMQPQIEAAYATGGMPPMLPVAPVK